MITWQLVGNCENGNWEMITVRRQNPLACGDNRTLIGTPLDLFIYFLFKTTDIPNAESRQEWAQIGRWRGIKPEILKPTGLQPDMGLRQMMVRTAQTEALEP